MTAADSGQYFIFLVDYYQTPAQLPFRGHLPWSQRCPLNIGSAVFRSPYQGKMLLIATTKQNTLSSESPFPEIHFASSATSCFLSFNKVVFSLSIFLIYKGVNNTENACNEAKWTQKYDPSLRWNLFFMFLTCIQTPPSAQIKKWGERRLWIAHVNRVPVYICIN